MINGKELKQHAAGRELDILINVAGIPEALLDGKHHGCPQKCQPDDGGKDRFRLRSLNKGGVLCGQCFDKKNGDFIAAVMWMRGISFPAAVKLIADHVGYSQKSSEKPQAKSLLSQCSSLSPNQWDACFSQWAKHKPPVTLEAIKATESGVVIWPLRNGCKCVAFAALLSAPLPNAQEPPNGIILYRADGSQFPAFGNLSERNTHMIRGSKDGWIVVGGWKQLRDAPMVVRCEGIPDALASWSALGGTVPVVTNICGAKASGSSNLPFEMFKGKRVVVIGDLDEPGQDGAARFANQASKFSADVRVVQLPGDITTDRGRDVRDFLHEGGSITELMALADSSPPWRETPTSEGLSQKSGTTAKRIVDIGTDEHRVNDEVCEALSRDPDLFQRGGELVRVITETTNEAEDIAVERPKSGAYIAAVKLPTLREWITRLVTFKKTVGTDENEKTVDASPPDWCGKAIHARCDWRGVRRIQGVITSPVVRADGSIIVTPGYDSATRLYLQPRGPLPTVLDNPTRADALAAAAMLLDVVSDFPFGKPEHRSAWLALLLTPIARHTFDGPAPLFLMDANTRGSGKSKLTDIVATIALGQEMPRTTNPRDDEEFRKRITSLVLAGDSMVLIDNVSGNLGCGSLDAALTSTIWKDRILGRSEVVELPLRLIWMATGNNVLLAADTSRRVLHVRLESQLESPELRSDFKYPDLLRHVRDQRCELLAAALTIVSAFIKAGKPRANLPPWGSFEGWSDVVRHCIAWLGLSDPGLTRQELVESSDREANALRNLLEGWDEFDPDYRGYTAQEVLERLQAHPGQFAAVRDAVFELCPVQGGKTPTSRAIGNKFAHLRRRIIGGRCLDYREGRSRSRLWSVRATDGDSDASGDTVLNHYAGTNQTTFSVSVPTLYEKGAGK